MLRGRRLSILGDSISTYTGASNNAAARCDTLKNPCFYREPFPYGKTYWAILLEELSLTLCVNNSWSGGNLTGRDNPDSGVCRAARLARDSGEMPDFIIIFMGINDLGRGVSEEEFKADYTHTLKTTRELYKNATVCCVNIPDRAPVFKKRAESFNLIIDEAVRDMGEGFFVADLFRSRLNNDFYYMNTVDGLHPDEDGMRIIADVILNSVRTACSI